MNGLVWAFSLALTGLAFVWWVMRASGHQAENNLTIWKHFARVRAWFVVNAIALIALLVVNFVLILPKWWPDAFAVATNLLAGGLVSFLFYYLVVHLPEHRKKAIIKGNLLTMYRRIKKDILRKVVAASIKGGRRDLATDTDSIDRLMTPEGFKTAFKDGKHAHEGFYAFENQMDEDTMEFREIVLNLEMLSKQIEFLLHNYSIDDQETFDFFKRLELLLIQLRAHGPGYDEAKPLCSFIYQLFAGWDAFVGYIDHDWLERKISKL